MRYLVGVLVAIFLLGLFAHDAQIAGTAAGAAIALWAIGFGLHRFESGDHEWVGWHELDEPGVPAQWHRCAVHCARCGEQRKVFHGIDRSSPALVRGCEGGQR